MQAHLQGVEVEPAGGRDDDLAVENAALRQRIQEGLMQIWKVTIERSEVPALDEYARVAEHQRAKAVPLRLVEKLALGRKLVRHLGEHRLDWRGDRGGLRSGRHVKARPDRAATVRRHGPCGRRPSVAGAAELHGAETIRAVTIASPWRR